MNNLAEVETKLGKSRLVLSIHQFSTAYIIQKKIHLLSAKIENEIALKIPPQGL